MQNSRSWLNVNFAYIITSVIRRMYNGWIKERSTFFGNFTASTSNPSSLAFVFIMLNWGQSAIIMFLGTYKICMVSGWGKWIFWLGEKFPSVVSSFFSTPFACGMGKSKGRLAVLPQSNLCQIIKRLNEFYGAKNAVVNKNCFIIMISTWWFTPFPSHTLDFL